MADPKKPLPTHEEVLICTKDTTVEEVKILKLTDQLYMNVHAHYRLPYFGIVQSMMKERRDCFVLLMQISYHLVFLTKHLITLK